MNISMRYLAKRAVVIIASGIGAFQCSLAAGAPWGAAAWGGGEPGRLPAGLRWASTGSALVWFTVARAVSRVSDPPTARQRRALRALAGVGVLAGVMNALSPSPPERLIWGPVSALLAVAAWRAAGPDSAG